MDPQSTIKGRCKKRNTFQLFRGVRKRKWGRWVSEIRIPKSRRRIWLGSYDTPVEAARAYDAGLYCLRGRASQCFNFPPEGHLQLSDEERLALTREDVKSIAARYALSLPLDINSISSCSMCSLSSMVRSSESCTLPIHVETTTCDTNPSQPTGSSFTELEEFSLENFFLDDEPTIEELTSIWK